MASNVPGHEPPRCYVTDGDSDKLVGTMMRGLSAISDTAFDMLIPSYDNVLNELEVRKEAWNEAERKALKEDESKQDDDEEVEMEAVKTNPYKTLIGQLLGWLHQLPVIGFNSGKYDLNVIKQFFVPYLLKPSKQEDNDDGNDEDEEQDDDDDETRFVIKRQNTFMFLNEETKISRHHQLPSAWVQLRQVSEGVRLRVAEWSLPIRVHGRYLEIGG